MEGVKSKSVSIAVFILLFSSASAGLASHKAHTAKNIILLISDGCGYFHVDAASIYQYGATGTQAYEHFPVVCGMSTYMVYVDSLGNVMERGYDPTQAWNSFDYVMQYSTDSAAAATAISTGVKTYNGAIGVDPKKRPLRHITQFAEDLGKATGVVTSVQWSHATPAGFVAHNVSRHNYVEIAREMILDSACEVIMGCGHPLFDSDGRSADRIEYKYLGGEGVWDGLVTGAVEFDVDGDGVSDKVVPDVDGDGVPDPWTLVQTRSQFQALMTGPTPKRVFGIPQVRSTLQYDRSGFIGTPALEAVEAPYSTPPIETVPTLEEMTRAALNVLDDDPDGFFLMVEGGAVDWAGHDNHSARMIEEEIDFNRSVEAVIRWVEGNSSWDETLVIVTGDHECGYLTGPGSGLRVDDPRGKPFAVWNPIENNGTGKLPGMEWHSDSHTNSLIPLYAKGPGSERFHGCVKGSDPVRGPFVDNTDVARVMRESFE
ncbi:MAG: alkaline phosphatase [bacterium]